VNCTAVRDVLPEFALGVAAGNDSASIELHVETCAACRKEAIDLQRAAAAFGYALAPIESAAPELEDRVVGAVQGVARPSRPTRGRGRRAGVVLLAAAIVVAGIGVGSVFAGRAERLRLQAERTALAQDKGLGRFGVAATQLAPDARVLTGMLSARSGTGTGSALTIVAPGVDDQIVVIVNDLADRALPLSVSITDTKGRTVQVGTIKHLDSSGGATLANPTAGSLSRFVDVIVRDARGHIVLRGTLEAETAVASPSP
jgi:predicted anti-sigma-YlaC factor YlaD